MEKIGCIWQDGLCLLSECVISDVHVKSAGIYAAFYIPGCVEINKAHLKLGRDKTCGGGAYRCTFASSHGAFSLCNVEETHVSACRHVPGSWWMLNGASGRGRVKRHSVVGSGW